MRNFKLILIITFNTLYLSAQSFEVPKDTFEHQILFSIFNNENNNLDIKILEEKQLENEIEKFKIFINDADLVINTNLKPLRRKQSYTTDFNLRILGSNKISYNQNNISNQPVSIRRKMFANKITWKNIAEGKVFPNSNYLLTYTVIKNRVLGIDCLNPPSFKWKQQWKYLAGFSLGIGTVAASRIIRDAALSDISDANEYREAYIDLWKAGSTKNDAQEALEENNYSFDRATGKNGTQKALFWIGTSLYAVSALGYLINWRVYVKKNELYDANKEQCKNYSINYFEIKPMIEANPMINSGINQHLGLSLTYTF